MFSIGLPHSVLLVVLSVVLAVFGGYVGLGLATRARAAANGQQKLLLAAAAWALALGIWTMHFVGMQAAHFPAAPRYSVLLTLVSFLVCMLVVGLSAFIESRQQQGGWLTALSAVFMGTGVVTMHYIGMHAIDGGFALHHDYRYALASAILAITASYGALRALEAELSNRALTVAAIGFGFAVSGMHYTAMAGTRVETTAQMAPLFGDTISSDTLAIGVAVFAFLISGIFLLSLIPEKRSVDASMVQQNSVVPTENSPKQRHEEMPIAVVASEGVQRSIINIPVETEGATKFVPCERVCSVHATTHYTLIYDGTKEFFSPWSISEAEKKLQSNGFIRVHRSYLVAVDKINALKKVGTEAVVEVGSPIPRAVPVSRRHYAELKARLGLSNRLNKHQIAGW